MALKFWEGDELPGTDYNETLQYLLDTVAALPDSPGDIAALIASMPPETQQAVFNALAANSTAVITDASFQDWRAGQSPEKLMTVRAWAGLFVPQQWTVTGPLLLDFGDNPIGGASINLNMARSLRHVINMTGNVDLSIKGVAGSLTGQDIMIRGKAATAGAKTLTIAAGTAEYAGQTVKVRPGVFRIPTGANVGDDVLVWVNLVDNLTVEVTAWS